MPPPPTPPHINPVSSPPPSCSGQKRASPLSSLLHPFPSPVCEQVPEPSVRNHLESAHCPRLPCQQPRPRLPLANALGWPPAASSHSTRAHCGQGVRTQEQPCCTPCPYLPWGLSLLPSHHLGAYISAQCHLLREVSPTCWLQSSPPPTATPPPHLDQNCHEDPESVCPAPCAGAAGRRPQGGGMK